jgi:hypothetical protein
MANTAATRPLEALKVGVAYHNRGHAVHFTSHTITVSVFYNPHDTQQEIPLTRVVAYDSIYHPGGYYEFTFGRQS